jgi:hypothetical protein
MIVVSYGTQDGIYDVYLRRLEQSCERHGMKHDMRPVPRTNRWDACRQKPGFLLEMLAKHDDVVVWIDADSIVNRPFAIPAHAGWDIGLVPNNMRERRKQFPLASFVVAIAPTEPARAFLKTWDHLCRWPVPEKEWNGYPFTDHHRLAPTCLLHRGQYSEIDLSRSLHHAIIRDFGRRKQGTIETDFEWYSRWAAWKAKRLIFRSAEIFT